MLGVSQHALKIERIGKNGSKAGLLKAEHRVISDTSLAAHRAELVVHCPYIHRYQVLEGWGKLYWLRVKRPEGTGLYVDIRA